MRGLRVIDRYLLRRQIVCLFAVDCVVVTVALLVMIVQDINDLMRQNASLSEAVAYFSMRVPYMLVEYMPVAVFLSVLVNLGILMRRREISAMMAAGISHGRIAAPLLAFSIVIGAAVFAWNETLATDAQVKADEIWSAIKHDTPTRMTQLKFMRGAGNRLYALSFVHRKRLHNFVMLEMGENGFRAPKVVLSARQAYWNHGQWNFVDGQLYRYDDNGKMTQSQSFGAEPITYPIQETAEDFSRYQQKVANMTLEQLFHFMRILKSVHEDTAELWPQVHARFAYPVAPFVMTLLAAAIVLHSWEERRTARIALLVLAAPAYLALLEVCLVRAPAGPHLSAWIPNLLFGVLGATLLKRSSSY